MNGSKRPPRPIHRDVHHWTMPDWAMGGNGGNVNDTPKVPAGVDPTRLSPARLHDYLGGTANFAVDPEAAERLTATGGLR